MSLRRRASLLAAATAFGALAAMPATGDAATGGPPPACFESPQVAVCTSDVGPLANKAVDDPAGTAALLVGVAEDVACWGNDICSAISTG